MDLQGKNADKSAIYAKVAYDIASRIASGELPEGGRFSGRSLMGTEYRVSQETIRRAMKLLADMDIVSIRAGSGAVVQSREKAAAYLEKYRMSRDLQNMKDALRELMVQRETLDGKIEHLVMEIFDLNDRFERSNPLRNYEFRIQSGSPLLGKTIKESDFRRTTGALIVALRRNGEILLSPDPELRFALGDIIVVAGTPFSVGKVEELLR